MKKGTDWVPFIRSRAQRLNSFLMGGSIERQKNVCFLIIFLTNWQENEIFSVTLNRFFGKKWLKSDMNALNNASINDENSKGFASFVFPEAKSSKTGVSVRYAPSTDKQWYVLRIKYGRVQAVADAILEDGTYVYLAKVWKDFRNKVTGKKQRKLFPFMNILFVYATAQEVEMYVKGGKESEYTTYYYNHFQTDQRGQNPPLTVSSKDMEPFVRITALQDEHVMEVDSKNCRFVSDDIVRVTVGPFEGVTGRVARIARQNRVVVHIKGLESSITTAYIPPYYLEKVEMY